MTQPNDAQDAVSKLQVAVDLLKRLDDEGVRDVFPAVCELSDETVSPKIVESYVGRYGGRADEYAARYVGDPADDIPSSAFAFAVAVEGCDHAKTDAEIADRVRHGIHKSITTLCRIDRAEQTAGGA